MAVYKPLENLCRHVNNPLIHLALIFFFKLSLQGMLIKLCMGTWEVVVLNYIAFFKMCML